MQITTKGLSRFWTIFSVALFVATTVFTVFLAQAIDPDHALVRESVTIAVTLLAIIGFRYGMYRMAKADAEFYASLGGRTRDSREMPQTEVSDVKVYSLDDYRRDHPQN